MLIITWFIYIFAEAKIQHYLIEKRKWKPNYLQLFFIRGIVAILFGGFIGVGSLSHYSITLYDFQMWQYKQGLTLLLFQTTTFWLFFDLTLNYLRDRPWDYRGKTSGWLDRMPYDLWVVGKVLAVIVAVWSGWFYVTHV